MKIRTQGLRLPSTWVSAPTFTLQTNKRSLAVSLAPLGMSCTRTRLLRPARCRLALVVKVMPSLLSSRTSPESSWPTAPHGPSASKHAARLQGTCEYAEATLQGQRVLLKSANASTATRVRYCWADSPVCTLYDEAPLPAGPFQIEVINDDDKHEWQ